MATQSRERRQGAIEMSNNHKWARERVASAQCEVDGIIVNTQDVQQVQGRAHKTMTKAFANTSPCDTNGLGLQIASRHERKNPTQLLTLTSPNGDAWEKPLC